MFTGIMQGICEVTSISRRADLLTYEVDLGSELVPGLKPGASVSIEGVCQTVVKIDGPRATFDAVRETLDLTTLGSLEAGSRVAVERSARVGDEVGGHDVAGHVVGQGEVVEALHDGDVHMLRIAIAPAWTKYVLEKGFIAVNGSSLTASDVRRDEGSFAVHLIPETLRLTCLGERRLGDRVNIELDTRTVAIVDTVERVLAEREG